MTDFFPLSNLNERLTLANLRTYFPPTFRADFCTSLRWVHFGLKELSLSPVRFPHRNFMLKTAMYILSKGIELSQFELCIGKGRKIDQVLGPFFSLLFDASRSFAGLNPIAYLIGFVSLSSQPEYHARSIHKAFMDVDLSLIEQHSKAGLFDVPSLDLHTYFPDACERLKAKNLKKIVKRIPLNARTKKMLSESVASLIYTLVPRGIQSCSAKEVAIRTLLNAGADPNYRTLDGITLLHNLVQHTRSTKLLQILINRGARVNEQARDFSNGKPDIGGITPLHMAAQRLSFNVYDALVKSGANESIENDHNETPRDVLNRIKYFKPELYLASIILTRMGI